MSHGPTRRQFLEGLGAAACGFAWSVPLGCSAEPTIPLARPRPRVVIARDDKLNHGKLDEHRERLTKLLHAAMQKLTGAKEAENAWRHFFHPTHRIGIKVNTLGLSTHPAVVDAIVTGLRSADVPAENILVWDRFDVELAAAGFKLNRSRTGVRCRGTDTQGYGSGYQKNIEVSGDIGSCFSRIVAEEVDALICVPVLKDHNLAGVSLGMKNFFGAIHNPNKYHRQACDPYVVDVVAHRFIAPKWRLTVCDGTRAQYHAGPTRNPGFAWPFGGLIVGADFVATDAVAADLLEQQRQAKGLKTLAAEDRPVSHITTAASRGLGVADLKKIERIEI